MKIVWSTDRNRINIYSQDGHFMSVKKGTLDIPKLIYSRFGYIPVNINDFIRAMGE